MPKNKKIKPPKNPKKQTNKKKPLIQIIIIDNFLKTSIKISANMYIWQTGNLLHKRMG